MYLGKVIGDVDSDESSGACDNSRLKIVQKLDLYRNPSGPSTLAVDFLGAGDGDIVIVGNSGTGNALAPVAMPSLSSESIIMGILDRGKAGTPVTKAAD